ncbi:MAG: hybrid sensor histidine kinase/response regulator [Alphaproteobacteria bacterium]|nr:hybrid sensor histidine kinase/response regulator [Alphaproteobacteria bacterium]MBU1281549.1 hybrid sensor histidine kinase/response regulator [Alphaproteobacteria bacterium]MBU1574238.1 hybrid sensor histidine kinase/response regulator [Alphaproteobacteria bacterium]MBU1826923.1 hybrid sensor histidine kinase/response regulator [Alphaproteobacteria bacterium]MBU2080065.1 hybrid sensor histidine kinase/response regulator [Alphaproteobacteria bacterium]
MTQLSENLLNPEDSSERTREKLLKIVDVLMRQVEQRSNEHGAAYAQFQRAAMLEDQVRQRTADLEYALDLLNVSNARLAEANRKMEVAQRNLANAIETVREGFALFDQDDVLVLYNSRFAMFLPDIVPRLKQGISFSDYAEMVSTSEYLDLTGTDNAYAWASRRVERHRDRHVVFNVHVVGDRWIQISEHRTPDDGTVILQTDVTDLVLTERETRGRMLDDQAQMIRATLEHVSLGVCIFDKNCQLAGFNQRLGYLLGLPMTQLQLGAGFEAVYQRVSGELAVGGQLTPEELLAWVYGTAPRVPITFEMRHLDRRVLVVSAEDLPDGGFVMSVTDVTAERRAMAELTRTNETLEARVMSRTLDLEDALARAERANAARSRFVAAASHDLLQPLSAAKLFVASAEDGVSDDDTREVLGKAQNALESVENILSALLDISKLEAGRSALDIMPVPLAPMLAQLRDEFMLAAQAKGIDLRVVQTDQIVESDPTYLRRIVQNLMSNAIRYTETGRVLVGVRRKGSGRVRLQVWDTGPGIPEIEHQAVFQEFHRLGVSASASVGMGLGLAIVDRACAQLGHPIHLDSVVGKGTVFGIDLPPARQWVAKKTGTYLPEQASLEHSGGLMVLLVENDADVRRAVTLLLEKWGVAVVGVETGEEGLSLMEELDVTPDLMLVDYQLGEGMNGIAFIEAFWAKYGRMPTRLVTANRSRDVRQACQAAQIRILYKPIAPKDLEAFVMTPLNAP